MAYVVVVPETVSTKSSDAPSYQYELDFDYGTRTKTSIVIYYKVWGRIYGNGSYDGTNAMIAWPYANGKYPSKGVTLRPSGTFWYKPTWHSVTGSFTISNISMGTTSITTALEVTKVGGTNGTLSKKAGKSFSIPAWPSYIITYNANGGSGAPATGKKWKDEIYTVPSTKPTRTGYDFVNWKINTGNTVAAGGKISAGSNSNYILTAQWKAHTYSVVYNKNASDATGTTSTSSHTYGTAQALTANGFKRTGYTFKGWATSASSTTVAYSDKASVNNLTAINGGTYNLYAVWEEITYAVNIYSNGGVFSNNTNKISLTKYYTKDLTLNQPTRTHYTFKGWATSASNTTIVVNPNEKYTQNKENNLYAVWEENDVYLTLYGYSNSTDYTQIYNNYKVYKNETTTITLNDIQNVYQFLGWSPNKLDIVPYRETSITYPKTINVDKNSTFYGVYKDITPTLFKIANTDAIRASHTAIFPDYVNSPDTFGQIDQDGSGHKIFGYVELSGESLENLNVTKDDVSISPTLSDTTIKITKKANKLFFMIDDVNISFTSKYIVSFDCTDNLGKPVTFNVSVPYKQPIIDIFKSDGSVSAFVDEFRFRVNNHSNAIGTMIASYPKTPVSLPHDTLTTVCSLEIPRGTWIINIGARFTTNANGYRSACLANTGTQNDMNFRIPAVNGQYTQFRWSVVNSFSKPTTVYLNQYQNSNSTLTTGESGINSAGNIDPYYGSFICATRLL